MLNLLAISMWMPPTLLPRSIQVARLMANLPAAGWRPTVVTHDAATHQPPLYLDADLTGMYPGAFEQCVTVPLHAGIGGALRRMLRLGRTTSQMEVWSDRARSASLKLLRGGGFSAIASFAHPWEDHEIGLDLANRTGLPWLVHFADPWVDNPYLARFDPEVMRRWRVAERNVLERADAVVFVSEQTRSLVMSKYPAEWLERSYVVPHCHDASILTSASPVGSTRDRMRVVYTGNFYGARTAQPVLEGLSILAKDSAAANRFDIRFIGVAEPGMKARAAEMGLENMVTFCGQKSFRESMLEAADADVLLVIDADIPNSVFMPSKLVEYVGLGRPILGVVPETSASAELLGRLECLKVAPGDPEGLAAALSALFEQWRRGLLAVSPGHGRIAQEFDPAQVARRFGLVLCQAVNTRRGRA